MISMLPIFSITVCKFHNHSTGYITMLTSSSQSKVIKVVCIYPTSGLSKMGLEKLPLENPFDKSNSHSPKLDRVKLISIS